jgi:methylated-DNA-[protein]-cysteine S-methyltransferase
MDYHARSMTTPFFALFDTSIGCCGIAWGEAGIAGVQLPEQDEQTTRLRMQRRFPQASETPPPSHVGTAIALVVAMLDGRPADVSGVELDMTGVPAFHRRVYALALAIPAGATRTYGEVASALGEAGAARAVGQALGRNPFAPIVPCHRVLAAGGKSGGFSAPGGVTTKYHMLRIEGALPETPDLFD